MLKKKYFYPKADLIVEYNDFYGKLDPTLDSDAELTLSVNSKVYSDISVSKISEADNNRLSALYDLKEKEIELYFEVMEQLINIERSREFLKNSDMIRGQMNDYIAQITNAVDAGISPRSYLRETQLVKVRFDDAVATVKSDIDRYFTQLSLSTGYQVVYKEFIGLKPELLDLILLEDIDFDGEKAVIQNFGLLSQYHIVQGLRYSAKNQFEKLKLTAFNDVNVGIKSNSTN